MKKLIYISVTLLIATNAIAQNQPLVKSKTLNPLVENILRQQANANLAERSTDLKERVIASSGYTIYPDSVVKLDSTAYKYSGSRGSQFDYYFGYDVTTPFGYYTANIAKPIVNNVPFMDAQMPVECDTFREWNSYSDVSSGIFIENDSRYDGHNNLIDFTHTVNNVNYFSYIYYNTYNANNLVTLNDEYYNAGDTANKRYFFYNSSNKLILDSTVRYSSDSLKPFGYTKNTYQYDSTGKLNSIASYIGNTTIQTHIAGYNFTYYSDSKLKTYADSGSYQYDSFAYSPGFNYPINIYTYALVPSKSSVLAEIVTYHLNKDNLPDTIVDKEPGFDTTISVATYDSFNNPITFIYPNVDTHLHYNFYITTYYYETYTTTQVPTISQNTDNIKIYPNPATNQIYINLADAAKNTQAFVNIINANGQLIRTESIPPNSQTWQMSIADLTPGAYFISVWDKTGNKLHSQAIVKQ